MSRATFEVDGIIYTYPYSNDSVYIRRMFQIYYGDERLSPMRVVGNSPKAGLMDSEVDEQWVRRYWGE